MVELFIAYRKIAYFYTGELSEPPITSLANQGVDLEINI